MWFRTPSAESLTRPRLAVAVVSAVAAASVCYYAYQQHDLHRPVSVDGPGLHRSNAVRRARRSRRRGTAGSSSSSEDHNSADENADANTPAQPLGDGETVVDEGLAEDWWDDPGYLPAAQRAGHNIVNLLFRVSEDNARRNGCVHRGCLCNSCGMVPIRGIRYRCANCADFDLCETCEAQGVHTKTHIFYKIRVPAPPFGPRQMQPAWYTGDPDTCRRSLPRGLIAKLSRDTGFERPELEAFWEQWTFMANTEWREDPDELFLAMDRKTFERCLVPTGGSRHAAPNLIHDRMFAFYDYNKDGYIGFSEFIEGQSYRKRRDKLRKVFEGYDLDGDGYVCRKDFLRMFRAYYVLYRQMHKDILEGLEDQLLASTEAQQLVDSRQPLSSLFGREGGIPHDERGMHLEGKTLHRDGSVDVAEGTSVIAPDGGDTATRGDILTSLFACAAQPSNRWRLVARANDRSEDHGQRAGSPRVVDTDRPYLMTLIEPPTTLDNLPEALMGNHTLDIDEDDAGDIEREDTDDEDEDELRDVSRHRSETEQRMRVLSYNRRRVPRLEKRRRDMARAQLHERWRRRQFYLDQEEGGAAPDYWQDNEDIFMQAQDHEAGESSKTAGQPSKSRSRSSSKAWVADEMDDFDTRSNPSTSTSVPERWGDFEIPDSETDAGKEVLYQVTQQAFNELLDTIFKAAEDIAVEARETKEMRTKFKDAIDSYVAPSDKSDDDAQVGESAKPEGLGFNGIPDQNRALDELLTDMGYTVEGDAEPRNAVDLGKGPEPTPDDAKESETDLFHDPTMPQFRPNTIASEDLYNDPHVQYYPVTRHPQSPSEVETEFEATDETLARWKELGKAEEQAKERGGWGRLSFEEFEDIYRSQEYRGNRLDYLGSWIDFCIP